MSKIMVTELKDSTNGIHEAATLGEQLRHAREARGLAQDEVARALCLNIVIIQALENDTCHELAAPVFVQGYLRNYANLLRISLAHHFTASSSVAVSTPNVVYARKEKSLPLLPILRHILLRLLNYAIFIALAALIFTWWHERHHASENALSVINMSTRQIPFRRMNALTPPALITAPDAVNNALAIQPDAIQLMMPEMLYPLEKSID